MNTSQIIQSIGNVPLLSNTLRWYANIYPENSVVQIKTGQGRGLNWKRHHRYVNGYWLGHYELPIQQALERELNVGDTFFDVGANAGFFTLLASRFVGSEGKCVAFDPSPENCASIREQIELNAVTNCTIVPHAISNEEGVADFSFTTPGSPMGHLGKVRDHESNIRVKVTTLDAACDLYGSPNFIKMDIEGAEADALPAALKTLTKAKPGWLIELHGPECERRVRQALREADYLFYRIDSTPLNPEEILPKHFIARPNKMSSLSR